MRHHARPLCASDLRMKGHFDSILLSRAGIEIRLGFRCWISSGMGSSQLFSDGCIPAILVPMEGRLRGWNHSADLRVWHLISLKYHLQIHPIVSSCGPRVRFTRLGLNASIFISPSRPPSPGPRPLNPVHDRLTSPPCLAFRAAKGVGCRRLL